MVDKESTFKIYIYTQNNCRFINGNQIYQFVKEIEKLYIRLQEWVSYITP